MRHAEERGDGVKMLTRREKRVLKRLRTTDWVPLWSWDVYTMANLIRLGVYWGELSDAEREQSSTRIDELAHSLRVTEVCRLTAILAALLFVTSVLINRLG